MKRIIHIITGLTALSKADVGRLLLYLVAFVPMVYKLISPFFILAGLPGLTVIIMPAFAIIGLFMSWESLRRSITMSHIVLYVIFVIFLALSPLFHPETQELFDDSFLPFILSVSPFFFVGVLLDYDKDKYILRFVARVGVFVQLFWQSCLLAGVVQTECGTDDSLGEQMEAAYQLLFPIFVLYINIAENKNFVDILCAFIGTILLFMMGARGPIVVYIIFVVGYFLFFKTYRKYGHIKKGLLIFFFAVVYYYLDLIIMTILPFVANLGFSTRVFDSILDDSIVNLQESSDRDAFYGDVFKEIQADNGFGHGWLSDRLYTPDGMYVHNLELEILCQFGVVIGGLFLLGLVALIVRSYIFNKRKCSISIWYIVLCSGFFALQFSYTYVKYPLFFVFIGFLLSNKKKNICIPSLY